MIYSYNGIVLEIVKTNNVSFDAVRTEDDMDYLYTRVHVDVQATVNPEATAYLLESGVPTAQPGVYPATTMEAIRHMLMQPRQQLLITDLLGQTMLECPVSGYDVDVKDGPKPLVHNIFSVDGSRTFMVRFSVECHIIDCPSGITGNTPIMISNRWSDSHRVNESQLTTRTISGRSVFRKDLMEAHIPPLTPDNFRNLMFPPTGAGLQRVAIDIVQNSAGNEAVWRITEVERVYNLGETDPRLGPNQSGIVELKGTQTIGSVPSGVGGGGPTCGRTTNQIILTSKGTRISNQWKMIQGLWKIALTMVDLNGANYISQGSISRSLEQDAKWVELRLIISQNPPLVLMVGSLDVEALKIDVGFLFFQTGVNPAFLSDNSTRGSFLVQLLTQSLSTSCEGPTFPSLKSPPQLGPGTQDGPSPIVTVGSVDVLPEQPSQYSMNARTYPYTAYKIEVKYGTNCGILQPTSAGSPGSSRSTRQPGPVFRLHQPMSMVTVAGMAERLGANPTLPLPQPSDPNYVLKDWWVSGDYPAISDGDGVTPVTRCQFWYEYAMLVPPDPTAPSLTLGTLPWTTIPGSVASLQPSDFDDGIMGI